MADLNNLNPFQEELRYRIFKLLLKSNQEGTVGMTWECFKQNLDTSKLSGLDGAPRGTNVRWQFDQELKALFPKGQKHFIYE